MRRVCLLLCSLAAIVVTGAGCSIPGKLGASSTCTAFDKASVQDEQQVVIDLYHKAHPSQPKTGPAAANAILNVSYECQQEPGTKLGDLGDFRSGS